MTLGRRKALSPTLTWIEEKRTELENNRVSEPAELLTQSFPEWCQSLKIKTPTGLQPFELFDWQKDFANLIVGNKPVSRRAIALLSSRQTGKTSLLLSIAAYLAQSRPQFTAVIIHRTTQDAHLLCRRVKRFVDGVKLKTDSLSLLEFAATDSALHFRSSNPSKSDGAEQTGRGLESVDLVIVEEASHTENLKDVLGVIAPALTWSAMGIVCFVGTASSKQSYYYENLSRSAGGSDKLESLLSGIRAGHVTPFQILDRGTGAIGVVTNWRAIDRFKQEPDFLKRVQDEFDLDDSQIDSEYELIFGSGGDAAVFDFQLVQAAAVGELDKLDEEVSRGGIFYGGVDPAAAGKDFTVCAVLHHSHGVYRLAALYRKRSGTSEAHLGAISDLLSAYNPVSTAVEANSIGALYLENLTAVCRGQHIEKFTTTQTSKELLVGKITLALERGELIVPSGIVRDELLSFRRSGNNGQKLGAAAGSHDDVVIAIGLALVAAQFGKHIER